MIFSWLETNNSSNWRESLKFVQFMKNRAYHSSINRSPYEAMFGCKAKTGLLGIFPVEALQKISYEKVWENILQENLDNDTECSFTINIF